MAKPSRYPGAGRRGLAARTAARRQDGPESEQGVAGERAPDGRQENGGRRGEAGEQRSDARDPRGRPPATPTAATKKQGERAGDAPALPAPQRPRREAVGREPREQRGAEGRQQVELDRIAQPPRRLHGGERPEERERRPEREEQREERGAGDPRHGPAPEVAAGRGEAEQEQRDHPERHAPDVDEVAAVERVLPVAAGAERAGIPGEAREDPLEEAPRRERRGAERALGVEMLAAVGQRQDLEERQEQRRREGRGGRARTGEREQEPRRAPGRGAAGRPLRGRRGEARPRAREQRQHRDGRLAGEELESERERERGRVPEGLASAARASERQGRGGAPGQPCRGGRELANADA